jgi:hypothetical protein
MTYVPDESERRVIVELESIRCKAAEDAVIAHLHSMLEKGAHRHD